MSNDLPPKHFTFIVNPRAGRFHNDELIRRIEAIFLDEPHGHTAEVILTDRRYHASELAAKHAARHGANLIAVACGGDGTANEVVNGIFGTAAALAILPIGTANDFARAALSTTNLDQLLAKILQPDIRPIDVIQVDERICLNIASMGFDTKVQRTASAINAKVRWLGSLSYPLAIFSALFGGREYAMHYQLQTIGPESKTATIEGDANFILAAICNGRYYGGGFNPAPNAILDDGRLDFCMVDSLPLRRILALIPLYKKGRHLSDPAVHCWQVTGGRIAAPAGNLLGNLDGEDFEKPAIVFKVIPAGLRFAFY
jgi:diacylglycerol kinase (ATP)